MDFFILTKVHQQTLFPIMFEVCKHNCQCILHIFHELFSLLFTEEDKLLVDGETVLKWLSFLSLLFYILLIKTFGKELVFFETGKYLWNICIHFHVI